MIKLTNQLTIVICVGITGMVAMVWFLTAAGWSDAAITAMITGVMTSVGALVVVVRNQVKQADQLDQMQQQIGAGQKDASRTLDTVVRQTNGLSASEREDIATQAGIVAATSVVARLKSEGHLPS